MTLCLGTVPSGSTLYIPFTTYDGSNGSSVTATGLAVTDIEIYKNGSVTQRASDAGYALLDTDGLDFDSITGLHGFSIDLSDNTDADFYAVGSWYWVVVSAITVDSQTVTFLAAIFRIGPAEAITGYPVGTVPDTQKVDVNTIKTQTVNATAGVTVGAYIGGTGAAALEATAQSVKTKTDGLNFTGTDVKATLDGEEVTPTAASKTGYSLAADQSTVTIGTVTTLTNLPAITTDWLSAAGVSAAAVAKIQSGLATPTNITAGTITTVTNVTNGVTLANGAHGGAAATLQLSSCLATNFTVASAMSWGSWLINGVSVYALSANDSGDQAVARTGTNGFATLTTLDAYLSTNLGLLGANATEAGGTGDHLTALGDARLANLDVGVSTRQATVANLANTVTMAAQFATMVTLDGAVYDFTAAALAAAPTGGSAPTVTQIREEMDTNSTKLANLDTAVSTRQATVVNLANTVTMAASFAAMAPLNVFTAESLANTPTGGAGGDTKEDIYTYFVSGTNPVPFRATTAGIQTALGMADADMDIRLDAILAAASPQGGVYTQTVTVKTTGGVAIPNATVAIYSGSVLIDTKTTNASGIAQPTCDANPAYTLRVTATGYASHSAALAVTGDATLADIELTAITVSLPEPGEEGQCTAYSYVYDEDGNREAGAIICCKITREPSGSGIILENTERTEVSDSTGLVSFTKLWIGATYFFYRNGSEKGFTITIREASVTEAGLFPLPNFLG